MRVDASAQAAATQAVSRAAQATGVDFSLLLATAKRESGLNQNAHASTSSAAGLFQFVDSTWMTMIERYGAKHGLNVDANDPRQRQAILNLRFNPDIAAVMAGELAHENAAVLETKLGRAATPGELYAAHVLGPSSAAKMIEAAASGQYNAAALDPRAAAANREIFYEARGAPRSAAQVLAKLDLAPQIEAPIAAPQTAAIRTVSATRPNISALMNFLAPSNWSAQSGVDLWSIALRAYKREDDKE